MCPTVQKTARAAMVSGAALMFIPACAFLVQTASNFDLADTTPDSDLPRTASGLLSAFHGLDELPIVSHLICRGAAGKTGMPVVFSTELDLDTLQAGDFEVTTTSGQQGKMHCVSVLPATDPGELRTVLLIGNLGLADVDPPVAVSIKGNLHSIDGAVNYKGAQVEVTPLADGPSIVFAERVEDWTLVGTLGPKRVRGTLCPEESTRQAVRVTWAGGVTLIDGGEPGETERGLYAVTVEDQGGTVRAISPNALADLGDGDNNHMLCLDTDDRPLSVAFPAGVFSDPNGDLNPATKVDIEF